MLDDISATGMDEKDISNRTYMRGRVKHSEWIHGFLLSAPERRIVLELLLVCGGARPC